MFGTEEQKMKWLAPFTSGEKIGCFALSEPGLCVCLKVNFFCINKSIKLNFEKTESTDLYSLIIVIFNYC